MGGHGGLNILPQKKWNVYNFDNREKVRKDEEEAAKEEQFKREQSRKRDSEVRLLHLRRARGLDPPQPAAAPPESKLTPVEPKSESKSDSNHINLFEGIKIFDPVFAVEEKEKKRGDLEGDKMRRKMKKEEEVRVVGPEDEKYRLGYGVAGKGVKTPWYAVRRGLELVEEEEKEERESEVRSGGERKRKKTVEELREERLKREKVEKERERALVMPKGRSHGSGSVYQDRYYQRSVGRRH